MGEFWRGAKAAIDPMGTAFANLRAERDRLASELQEERETRRTFEMSLNEANEVAVDREERRDRLENALRHVDFITAGRRGDLGRINKIVVGALYGEDG